MPKTPTRADSPAPSRDPAARVYFWVVLVIVCVMTIDLAVMLGEQLWLNAALILAIASLLLASTLAGNRLAVRIPYEFQLMALVFVFAALFLGEFRSYYVRFWWWDIVLHAASGCLLGIVGFLLVYVLNESRRVPMALLPQFVALFAFLFAVTVGALWEVFEYAMDRVFGMDMQKTMLGDTSGLTDTMWDLIVDIIGAAFIAVLGWWHMVSRKRSFIDHWIDKFIHSNPRLFQRSLRDRILSARRESRSD